MARRVLLHVVLELIDGAFLQVPAEQREEVGVVEQGLHQGAMWQLTCNLEDDVCPRIFKRH